jgi:manganese-dependent inorganic pyrophosphatase
LKKLETISSTNARNFAEKFFASASMLTLKSASQAITTDCKEYKEEGKKFSIAQVEEIGFEQFWKRRDELVKALETYCKRHSYFFSALLVTDVVTQISMLLIAGDEEFAQRIGYPSLEPGTYELRDVVSRKKQLLPYLIHCLRQVGTRNG